MVDQSAAVSREDALAFADEAFRNRDITFSGRDVVDMTAALGSFLARHRVASLPCKSGEGAGGVSASDPAKIALDAYNQGYRDGCEDSGGEADAESSRDGFHDWLHDYRMPEPRNTFAIELPSSEGRAEVREQDDGKWQVFVGSENAFEGGYRSAWNLPTFEAAVRNIMDVLWEGCLPFDAAALTPDATQTREAETSREGCTGTMDAERATYFLERFKREEKLLGPHEQWALDFTIAALNARGGA